MRDFISKNFFSLIIVVLILVLFVQRCDDGEREPKDIETTIKIDTIWVVKDSIVWGKPQILYGRRDTMYENTIQYIPSENYELLVKQFTDLRQELLTKNTFVDTLRIDTTGYVVVKDEIQKNLVSSRKYEYSLKYPELTKTITNQIYVPDGKQVYLGGGVGGNKTDLVNSVNLGLLYKDKKDRIFGVGVNKMFAPNLPLTYGVSTYWKIKLK